MDIRRAGDLHRRWPSPAFWHKLRIDEKAMTVAVINAVFYFL
ncbi:hypothetical protein BACCAP_04708 [Pseudoflavonifractor capillosus ATCC 29799]|uniref:Uncharacterized protein n=1 Tax=Pseudoflavonifractor capillosus ATCC 29799 TaxID=411467 RepID=A6P2H7_9FIRM|nr:hypothetical protein BACCAP_04708 [Pseudoflavonifractor capillosus ATCC 29799]